MRHLQFFISLCAACIVTHLVYISPLEQSSSYFIYSKIQFTAELQTWGCSCLIVILLFSSWIHLERLVSTRNPLLMHPEDLLYICAIVMQTLAAFFFLHSTNIKWQYGIGLILIGLSFTINCIMDIIIFKMPKNQLHAYITNYMARMSLYNWRDALSRWLYRGGIGLFCLFIGLAIYYDINKASSLFAENISYFTLLIIMAIVIIDLTLNIHLKPKS